MSVISMKQLLESGVHFGHQTKRWNPKMAKYIFGQRNGIHIIDLQKTVKKIKEAYKYIVERVSQGDYVLFVGTKKQAQESIGAEAKRCEMYYINQRWVGGLLTNYQTIHKSIERLAEIEELKKSGRIEMLTKKEQAWLEKERAKLEKLLGGIKGMKKLPGLVFIVDTHVEQNAVKECRKMEIPVVGVVDSDCDPDQVDHIIPANDDAIRAIKLLSSIVADAVLEGQQLRKDTAAQAQAAQEAANAAKGSIPGLTNIADQID
ncbi:MAG: 30S ribosomal protein S2 [Elusimicrobia bacterium]|nr:30S ribosomal protein S2 [Elusimicrobiota bacterium]